MDKAELKRLAVALIVIVVIGATYLLVTDDVDKCLDAGGSWMGDANQCAYTTGSN